MRKGDTVAVGDVLARLESRDLEAQRVEAQAALHQARVLAERCGRLFEEGAIPQRDLLQAETALSQSKARLELGPSPVPPYGAAQPFAGTVTQQFLYPGDMAQPINTTKGNRPKITTR